MSTAFDLEDLDDVVAREYLRVSFDKSGRLRSNEEQHDENVAFADRRRWQLGDPYVDEGSASVFQRKRRPGFDRLLADLESGTFGAHVLIVWEASRGTRQVDEMVKLLRLCGDHGIHIYVTSHRRLYDPRVVRDWRILMDEVLDAETEVRKTSERTKRASRADAADGRFTGGRRPYGYAANGIDQEPAEATVIAEAVERVLAGDTVRSIAADLNARGVPTSGGNRWHPGPLAKLLASPRIAGKRVHQGTVVGPAAWKGIIDEVTHRRVVATLNARSPVGRRGRTPWLLTGLLACGRCDVALVGNTDTGGTRRYVCRKAPGYAGCGGLGIKAEPLEDLLGVLVTERLADVEARRAADTGPDDDLEQIELGEIAVMRAEAAEDRAKGPRAGGIDRAAYADLVAALDRRQRDVEARLAAKVRRAAPLDLVADEGFVGRAWDELGTDEQRRRLNVLVERVRVEPATTRGSRAFEASRVTAPGRITWKV